MNILRFFSIFFFLYGPYQRDQRGVDPADCWNWVELEHSKITIERVPSLDGSWGSSCRCKRLLLNLGCPGQPSIKKFSHRALFQFMCPHRRLQPGQAVVQGRLSLNVCLRSMLCSLMLRKYGKRKEWGEAHPERIFMTAFFIWGVVLRRQMLI